MRSVFFSLFLLLTACGGDSGDTFAPTGSDPTPTPVAEAPAARLTAEKNPVLVGETVVLTGTLSPSTKPPDGIAVCRKLSVPVGSSLQTATEGPSLHWQFVPDVPGVYNFKFGWCIPEQGGVINWMQPWTEIFVTALAPPPVAQVPAPPELPPVVEPAPTEPPPEEPPPIPYVTLLMTLGREDWTAQGDLTYRRDAVPLYANLGNLQNQVYPLERWDFTVNNLHTLPSMTFSNGDGSTAEVCVGLCKFSQDRVIMWRLRKDGYLLEIVFRLLIPENILPVFAEIGAHWGSQFKEDRHLGTFVLYRDWEGTVSEPEM